MKRSLTIKLVAGVVALSVFGFLFIRSLEDSRAAPYTVAARHLRTWTLSLEPASTANQPLLVLRPAPELVSGLFRQVFARAMESLSAPVTPGIPVVLRSEFDRVVGDQLTQDALLTAARTAGLEAAPIAPKCLVHRRESGPGVTTQMYFIVFDAPAIGRFRQQLGLVSDALSPILFVAGAGVDPSSRLPQRVHGETDCVAPVEVSQ